MTFDPFGDFETAGYLRNAAAEKSSAIVKRLEHAAFVSGVSSAFDFLKSIENISYPHLLEVHRILFEPFYPWAGEDRGEVQGCSVLNTLSVSRRFPRA